MDDTEEKCNGTKLARLLIDGGTETLRRTFDSIHSPANLHTILHKNKPVLKKLLAIKVLNSSQWKKLYPPGGAASDSKTFDITLLFVLLRNICGFIAPATGWDDLPPAVDVSKGANLTRIKYYRNQVYGHVTRTGVSQADFEQYWNDISCALIALGADQVDIDMLKSSAIGETDYMDLLTRWKLWEDELKVIVNEVKEEVRDLKAEIQKQNAPRHTSPIENLTKCNFSLHTASLVDVFQEKTRQWALEKIERFCTNPEEKSRALVITALPGVGKSVLAAVVCNNAQERGSFGACHFVQHNNSQRNNPKVIIESIASHLCDSVEEFKTKLHDRLSPMQQNVRKKLDEMNIETLFTDLIEEPLSKIQCVSKEQTFVIVIDALDEIDPTSREEFISVLLSKRRALPKWIKLVVTSRPMKLLAELPHVTVVNIEATGDNNIDDIILYLSEELLDRYPDESSEKRKVAVKKLTETSQGMFLYAHFVIEAAKERNLPLYETIKLFPKGISSVYDEYLTRAQTELEQDKFKANFINFLKSIIAAQAPLPQSLVLQILGISQESRQELKVARKALNSLSLLFPVQDKCFSIFHKSLADWLTVTQYGHACHDFSVTLADGHRVLAKHCLEVLEDVKNRKNSHLELSDSENYALSFGFHHMLEAGGYKEQLGEFVQDLELLDTMWIAREKTTSTDPWVRIGDMVKELERISNDFSLPVEDVSHLCKAMQTTRVHPDCPHFVLQCAVYCPSDAISSKSTKRLSLSKDRKRAGPWVEKQDLYLFSEPLYVVCCCSSDHTVACVCVKRSTFCYVSHCNYTLMTLNIERRKLLAKVDLENVFNPCIQASPSDRYVVVYQELGNQLELRDLQTLHIQRTFETEYPNFLLSCCFAPGYKLAAGCIDGTVRVWDVVSGAVEATLQCSSGRPVYCTASTAGQLLAVQIGSEPFAAVLWQSPTAPESVQLASNVISHPPHHTNSVSFSPNGSLLTCVCVDSNMIRCNDESHVTKVFDATTAQLLKSFPVDGMFRPSIIFIDDSHLLLYNGWQMRVIGINDGSSQELATEPLLVYSKGIRECVAIDYNDHATLSKLTFHSLN